MFGAKFAPADILAAAVVAALAVFIVWRFHTDRLQGRRSGAAAAVYALRGAAKIEDGDSLKINGQRVRLVGIDAPELHQFCRKDNADYACGAQAAEHLRALINGRETLCRWVEKDKYQRLLGHCSAGETDLNRSMVADGWAVDYSYAPEGDNSYKREERAARAARRGIWQGRFQRPKNWRKQHPRL